MHQVRLAEADAAVDEQRVVGAARVLGDLDRGRARQLVALALDEIREREVGVQPAAELRQRVDRAAGRHRGGSAGAGRGVGWTGKPMPSVIWTGIGGGGPA